MSLARDDSSLFGFDTEAWLEHAQRAELGPELGRLGPYQLLDEAGRGGQGVVFRARQPGTGRDIALKRLLAGAFASAAARRRFEREVEAVTALSHPGIVTVYGVDMVDGAPLLAMEWIEGVPVNEWSAGRTREEVLALFLLVCDAIQHAHQRGVLHRDLKPSNVVVDRNGRPRVLDFGLAKLASDAGATVSKSGQFVGTPAYAAPEQWRGSEVDARADVYSLGALLFEMLTGRRVLEGDELLALAKAELNPPPRPSSLARSIPRELDAIVLQALAHEREARYQSVDALSGDVRRFLAGEPVLAHPPGAWYELRKLVARNRLASALVTTLLAATLVYAIHATRQARRLTEERNRAVAASTAEGLARAAAVAEKQRAEEALQRAEQEERRVAAALAETERERERAQAERAMSEAVLKFVAEDVIYAAAPAVLGHEPTLFEILSTAATKIDVRLGKTPAAEEKVREMMFEALHSLGHEVEAVPQARRSLELRRANPESTPAELGRIERLLGLALRELGEYGEAEEFMRASIAHYEAAVPPDPMGLAMVLEDLAGLCMKNGRNAEFLAIMERCATDPSFGADLNVFARGIVQFTNGRYGEACATLEEWLREQAGNGERTENVASVLDQLAMSYHGLGDLERAGDAHRKALAIMIEIFGEGHPLTAAKMGHLAQFLLETGGDLAEAEDLARRSLATMRALAPKNTSIGPHAFWLARALALKGDHAQAEPLYAEALAIQSSAEGMDDRGSLRFADYFAMTLTENGKLDEAEELVVDVIERRRRLSGPASADVGLSLAVLADVYVERGALDDAAAIYEDSVEILTPAVATTRTQLVRVLKSYARVLRELGETERADELERRAAELGGR